MVIRVFPDCLITGPRLARLRSYSFRMLEPFLSGGAASRNQSYGLATMRVDNGNDPIQVVHTDGNESPLPLRTLIFAGEGQGIEQRSFRVGKRDSMLQEIGTCLLRIPGYPHICIVCILQPTCQGSVGSAAAHLADFIGLDVCLNILEALHEG